MQPFVELSIDYLSTNAHERAASLGYARIGHRRPPPQTIPPPLIIVATKGTTDVSGYGVGLME